MRTIRSTVFFLLILINSLVFLQRTPLFAQDSPLIQAEEYFLKGQYSEALSYFQQTTGAERVSGIVGASRTLVMTGDYDQAEKICRDGLKEFPDEVRISTELAEILSLTGRSSEAMEILKKAVTGPDPTLRSLVQYGKLLRMRGLRNQAEPYFEKVIDHYNEGLVFEGEEIAMVAVAGWELESFHDANRLFREAIRVDPSNLEAQVLWGELFQEKYNNAEAQELFTRVLYQNESYVPALVGAAKAFGSSKAEEILKEALNLNQLSVPTLEVLAEVAIEDDLFDEAESYLDQSLAVNPESLKSQTLLATIAYLQENYESFQTIQKKVEQFSPGNGRFYAQIAEVLGKKYRFKEAVELARKAVVADPSHWNGFTVLGMNLLRLGEEEEGRTHLEFSFEKDPFNLWTKNMLRVLDELVDFETRETEHFVVRLHRSDADVFWPQLEPLLTEAWTTLTKKYQYTPEGPVLIEVFHKKEDFAVRTLGLPDIGPLVGVCFGNVITLASPAALKSSGSTNWQEIVWHEFVHVITLQMTRNRMPRWLSEGVSVFEEPRGRPEWGRKQNLDLIKAVQNDRLLSMTQLNDGFSKAKSVDDLSFAYFQSSLVVEHIVEKYGFDALRKLILQYAKVQTMETIFQTVFNKSLISFEKGFFSWIDERVKKLNVYVHQEDPHEKGAGHGHGMRRNSLDSLMERPDQETVAKIMLERVKKQPRDFLAHFQLGVIFYKKEAYKEAIKHLKVARSLLPEYGGFPSPYQILADLYKEQGNEKARLAELERWISFQQNAFEATYTLANSAYTQKKYERAVYYLMRALAINPYETKVHKNLAEIFLKRKQYQDAIREYRILVSLEDTDPVNARTNLADALLRDGQKAEAKETILAALEMAPTYERAQSILLQSLEP
ncbi:MAG: tetratricopeptide repeat protein [SAR324 cluster bacterium]|nr:tetratricopeptide repeat protein [SAR324 cluster bacterium]